MDTRVHLKMDMEEKSFLVVMTYLCKSSSIFYNNAFLVPGEDLFLSHKSKDAFRMLSECILSIMFKVPYFASGLFLHLLWLLFMSIKTYCFDVEPEEEPAPAATSASSCKVDECEGCWEKKGYTLSIYLPQRKRGREGWAQISFSDIILCASSKTFNHLMWPTRESWLLRACTLQNPISNKSLHAAFRALIPAVNSKSFAVSVQTGIYNLSPPQACKDGLGYF